MHPRRLLILIILFLATQTIPHSTLALGGPTITVPLGSNVNVDGTFQASEWSDAAHTTVNWAWSNSSLSPLDLYLKNNGTNLLVGATARGSSHLGDLSNGYIYELALLFDGNNNGIVDNYDAEKIVGYGTPPPGQGWQYIDRHYNTSQGKYWSNNYPNGTGAGSFTNYGGPGTWYWEYSIPMTSHNPESFNLPVNGTIGFEVLFIEADLLNSAWNTITKYSYWPVAYTTGEPSGANPSAMGWATLIRSNTGLQTTPNTTIPWYLNTWTFLVIGGLVAAGLAITFALRKKGKRAIQTSNPIQYPDPTTSTLGNG